MALTVERLMAQGVVIANPDHTVDYVLRQILTLDIQAVPVADEAGTPVGIVRSRDLLRSKDRESPVSEVMSQEVVTIDRGARVEAAASLMRRNRQRQLVVTEGQKIVGILSAFDFLQLVEGGSFDPADAAAEFRTGVIDLTKFRKSLEDDDS